MYINQFYNYAVHVLIPQKTEGGELAPNNIGGKYKDNIQLILNNSLRNEKWNQITNMIKEFYPPLLG